MQGQIGWTISLVMIGLFAIAVIGFTVGFANDNGSMNIADDSQISSLYSNTQGNISDFSSASQDTYASIINSSISSGGQTTVSGGQFAITPTSSIGVTKNILQVTYYKIFGTDNNFGIFLTTFLGMLVFITALLIWKTWAGRNPD